ncbi:hypothetical protein CHS0354_034475 [Potamilus streckersoni]|uniref:C2H2-type domain-containing protein n=1 Tax=Potamilus streckersoni TaxID=2493646 RepID=A0AAE0T1S9_9BIVA|nr:hypothetical protein CHS0354_034475 [Potamilus streckersoni]
MSLITQIRNRSATLMKKFKNRRSKRQHWQSGLDGLEPEDKENNVRSNMEVELEDESIAALALTSLSCSPVSPQFQGSKELSIPVFYQDNLLLSTSASSSGFSSNHSERSDPSPPFTHLSASDPSSTGMMFGPFVKDEEIEEEKQIKTMYKCTWKKCGKICSTNSSIEAHVRTQHLGLKENDSGSDGEEEFYYTEIEVNVDAVAQGISDMYIPSHQADSYMSINGSTIPDHDYQKKESKLLVSSVPSGTGLFHIQYDSQVNIPQMKRSISLQNNNTIPTFSSSPTSTPIRMPARPSPQERLQQHQAQSPKNHMLSSPPKSSGVHKKSRSEVRKCRKVYGMENRDMWCTQCKWKKACTRFLD